MRSLIVVAMLAAAASAASITWTGYANNNQWNTPTNWYPDNVPGVNDDVSIPSGVVQVTTPVAVNSLSMGTLVTGPANLTLFADFTVVSTCAISENGNVFLDSGAATWSGTCVIGGTLYFMSGAITGQFQVTSRGAAYFPQNSQKALLGASFQSQGILQLTGLLALNQSSVFQVQSATQIIEGLIIQNQDGSAVNFEASSAAVTVTSGDVNIMAPAAFGTLTLAASYNLTIMDNVTFSSALAIPSMSTVFVYGASVIDLTKGVSGAGSLVSAGIEVKLGATTLGGWLWAQGGLTNIKGTATLGGLGVYGGTVEIQSALTTGQFWQYGGTTVANAAVGATMAKLRGGIIDGTGAITGQTVSLKGTGVTLRAALIVGKTATVEQSLLTFGQAGSVTVNSGAVATVTGTFQLTGNAASTGVTNNGVINANAKVASQNINIVGSGTLNVAAHLSVNTATITQPLVALSTGAVVSGSNSFLSISTVSAPTTVKAVFGSYSLKCSKSCMDVTTPSMITPPSSDFHLYGM